MKKFFYKAYAFFAMRYVTAKAFCLWFKGCRVCDKVARQLNGPRVYLFYDRTSERFVPMVYDPRKKGDALSMRRLVQMGKIKVKRRMSVDDMKRESFYYTSSRWGAKGCKDSSLRTEKYKEWLAYYITLISPIAIKLRKNNLI